MCPQGWGQRRGDGASLRRGESSAAPSPAAVGSVPSSFHQWQRWKRDKGVTIHEQIRKPAQ